MNSILDAQEEYYRNTDHLMMPAHIHTKNPSGYRYVLWPIEPLPEGLLKMKWFELEENQCMIKYHKEMMEIEFQRWFGPPKQYRGSLLELLKS